MGKMSRKGFMDKKPTFSGGFFNLRKVGRTVGFINAHPKNGGYWTRKRHGTFASEGGSDKAWHGFNCVNQDDEEVKLPCPMCLLKDFAEREMADGFKPGTILISDEARGRDAVDFTLEELATFKTTARRTVASAVKDEIALAWISIEPDLLGDEKPIKEFTGTSAILFDFQKMMAHESEEHGEDAGDPVENPYPIVMTYDKDAKNPQDYYDVRRSSKDIEITGDLLGLLNDDPRDYDVDLEKVCAPGAPADMLDALEKAWASKEITFDSFREFYEKRAGKKGGGSKRSSSKRQSKPKKEPEPEQDDEGEEETFECECGELLPWSTTECPNCGAQYDADEDDAEDDPEDEGSDNRAGTWCETCQENVEPNKKGRCPECFSELDVL